MSDEVIALAKEIAGTLNERMVGQVRKVIHVIGPERARAHLSEALAIAANGGMKTNDGQRDRTTGGIFFHLVRGGTSAEEHAILHPRSQWPGEVATPRLPWSAASMYVAGLNKQPKGELNKVQLKIVGRPKGAAKTRDGECMVVMVEGGPVPPTLPRGIPTPPTQGHTVAVFISLPQWARVVDDLKKKTSNLRVHGYPVFNPESGTTILLAETVDIVARKPAAGE